MDLIFRFTKERASHEVGKQGLTQASQDKPPLLQIIILQYALNFGSTLARTCCNTQYSLTLKNKNHSPVCTTLFKQFHFTSAPSKEKQFWTQVRPVFVHCRTLQNFVHNLWAVRS